MSVLKFVAHAVYKKKMTTLSSCFTIDVQTVSNHVQILACTCSNKNVFKNKYLKQIAAYSFLSHSESGVFNMCTRLIVYQCSRPIYCHKSRAWVTQ